MNPLVNEKQDEQEIILDPRDGTPVEDPVMALAIKEGCHYVTARNKLVINWPQFMAKRRQYRDAPDYAKLTPRQLSLYWKLREGNFMPFSAMRMILNTGSTIKAWEIIKAKGIPIYKFPPGDQLKVLSTDFILMVDSCQLDLDAEGGVWKAYIQRYLQNTDQKYGRDTRKKFAIRREMKEKRQAKQRLKKQRESMAVEPRSGSDRLSQIFTAPPGQRNESPSPEKDSTSQSESGAE